MQLNQFEWNPEKDKIGEGAFAEVFKAKDTYANRNVALKIYKIAVTSGSMGSSSAQSKYSLEKEFQNLEGLSHTNIITYFGLNYIKHSDAMGRTANYPVIVMEYADQGTLKEFVKSRPTANILNKLIRDIVKGVGYLHEEGLLHRDLKLGNILITKNKKGIPTAKISDFGISKDTMSTDITKSFTEMVGTPHYMAPEQFHKKRFGLNGSISPRTDLWAIGVIAYKTLTGKYPFGEGTDDMELVREAITEQEPNMKVVPKEYQEFIARCLSKKAADRAGSADELLTYLTLTAKDVLPKVDEEKTYVGGDHFEKVSQPEGADRTVFLETESEKERPKDTPSLGKLQKIGLWAYAGVAVPWLLYSIFSGSRAYYVLLLYPLSVLLFCFFYVKPKHKYTVPRLLNYGLLVYCNLLLFSGVLLSFFSSPKSKDFVFALFAIVHLTLFSWLFFKELKHYRKGSTWGKFSAPAFILLFSILVYCVSYFMKIYGSTIGFSVLLLLNTKWLALTLLPNALFIAAILFFALKEHRPHYSTLIVLFIASTCIASLWWLLLESDSSSFNRGVGFYSTLINVASDKIHIPEFKIGYYAWFLSMFIGFMAIIHSALKDTKTRKFYWPAMCLFMIILAISFHNRWSKSELGHNFNEGIKNVDYSQFKKAMDQNAKLYFEDGVINRILGQYTNENKVELKKILRLFVDSSGKLAQIDDRQLREAVETNDVEVLEILANAKAGKFTDDVDFIEGNQSFLQMARDQENKEMEALLIKNGAKLTEKEQEAEEQKKQEALKAKELSFYEDFSNGSTTFKEFSNENMEWTHIYGGYRLKIKNTEVSHKRISYFNLDTSKPYSVSGKIQLLAADTTMGTGLVFDNNGTDYHIMELRGGYVRIYKYENSEWTEVKKVKVTDNGLINTMRIYKSGNYINCYLNDKLVISSLRINSTGGKYLGMICSNSNKQSSLYFDSFRVTGTRP